MSTKFEQHQTRRYLDKEEVAERYGVSPFTIVSWVRTGYIPYVRCGRLIRFNPVALDRWDAERATEGRTQITPAIA